MQAARCSKQRIRTTVAAVPAAVVAVQVIVSAVVVEFSWRQAKTQSQSEASPVSDRMAGVEVSPGVQGQEHNAVGAMARQTSMHGMG